MNNYNLLISRNEIRDSKFDGGNEVKETLIKITLGFSTQVKIKR